MTWATRRVASSFFSSLSFWSNSDFFFVRSSLMLSLAVAGGRIFRQRMPHRRDGEDADTYPWSCVACKRMRRAHGTPLAAQRFLAYFFFWAILCGLDCALQWRDDCIDQFYDLLVYVICGLCGIMLVCSLLAWCVVCWVYQLVRRVQVMLKTSWASRFTGT